jgi:hypothetical protein
MFSDLKSAMVELPENPPSQKLGIQPINVSFGVPKGVLLKQ